MSQDALLSVTNRAPCLPNDRPSFVRFNGLPLELRLVIWGFVCPSRRVIWIQQKHERTHRKVARHWFHHIDIPRVLHVCRESRRFGRQSYQLVSLKDAEIVENSSIKVEGRKCYIDFENDIIFASYIPTYYINSQVSMTSFDIGDVFNALGDYWKQITQIAYSHNQPWVSLDWSESVLKLEKLRKIYLICGQIPDGDNRYENEMLLESATILGNAIISLRLFEWPHPVVVDFIILPPFKFDNIGWGFCISLTRNINFGAVKADSGFLRVEEGA